jgi:spore coat polysaccharide biosynthesis protein SpsF
MFKKKVLAIILCRNNSSRLKNKLKLKIGKKTCFEFFFNRLKKCKNIDEYIIATTKNKNDNYFVNFAKKNKINIFRGSEKNVLKRMIGAYKSLNKRFDIIVRCNSDNILIMPNIIDLDINEFLKSKSDFFSPFHKNRIPFGYSLSLFKLKKLIEISKKKLKKKYTEHVDNYFLDNEDKIQILKKFKKKYYCPNLFLTLDTKFDYKRIKFYANKIKKVPMKNQARKLIKIFNKHK